MSRITNTAVKVDEPLRELASKCKMSAMALRPFIAECLQHEGANVEGLTATARTLCSLWGAWSPELSFNGDHEKLTKKSREVRGKLEEMHSYFAAISSETTAEEIRERISTAAKTGREAADYMDDLQEDLQRELLRQNETPEKEDESEQRKQARS